MDNQITAWQPQFLASDALASFTAHHSHYAILDTCVSQLEEVFLLRNPQFRYVHDYQKELESFVSKELSNKSPAEFGSWVVFPWQNAIVHYLPEQLHLELRTGRNRNLITAKEQDAFYHSHTAIFGMSVGSHAALTLTMIGGSKNLTLADPDTISGSNLNRIRTGFHHVGIKKVHVVAQQIYEMNPYSILRVYPEGISDDNIDSMLHASEGISLIVDEMDNPYFKFRARKHAKNNSIPLISAADNGDGVIAHVERYDLNADQKPFNGIMGSMTADKVKNLDKKALISVIAKTVGADKSVLRMQESVMEVGKTLYSWPQLGTAANLCGTVLAYLSRRIIVGSSNIQSGIYEVSMDAIFESDYRSPEQTNLRKKHTQNFLKKLGI